MAARYSTEVKQGQNMVQVQAVKAEEASDLFCRARRWLWRVQGWSTVVVKGKEEGDELIWRF